jgi:ferritin-like metal-binding protein YciE
MTKKETLIAWLNDAHAMELSLVKNLEGKSKDALDAGKSEVKKRIDSHIEETKEHARLIESCIVRHGEDPSTMKDVMGKTMGLMQGAMNSMYSDTMVKNALESYAAEQFEIAAYTSIIAAAEEVGDAETVDVCSRILEDEEEMSDWIMEQIPIATAEHINMLDE